jgi:Regulator of Chromosome Condensation (RCC1) repeat protein
MFARSVAARRPSPRVATASLLVAALATALACSEDRTPTGPDLKAGSSSPLVVTPTTLEFASPTATAATITATVQFVGLITASSSSTTCATVSPLSVPATKPPGSSLYVATFTVTPAAVGSCTITVTDKKGRQVQVPVEVKADVGDIRSETLVAGMTHTCGLTSGGTAHCWGTNGSGQLGDGSTTHRTAPTAVSGTLTFAGLTAGFGHTCGLTSGGTAHCWGSNFDGQLGDGTTTSSSTPQLVNGFTFQP